MKELIKYIAQALVDNPEQVEVREIKAQQTSLLELRVAKDDVGKVIGKKGRSAQAMRTVLSCAAAKNKERTILEIIDHKSFDRRNTVHESSREREAAP